MPCSKLPPGTSHYANTQLRSGVKVKGIAHFLTGVALATCIPEVVTLAYEGALLPVLGGVAALLPDLLDFRLVRYLETYDIEIDPGSCLDREAGDKVGIASTAGRYDCGIDLCASSLSRAAACAVASHIVEAFAGAMREAYATGVAQRVMLHTVRCGADLWRQYHIGFDPELRTVKAVVGPLVNTAQEFQSGTPVAHTDWVDHQLGFPLTHGYASCYHVDIFTGPSFSFRRRGQALSVDFLEWHHRWTHSLLLAGFVGGIVGAVASLLRGASAGWLFGAVVGFAFAAHALEDQLGHMGCNLFWPLTRRRQPGLGLLHATDPAPNFLTVWTALVVILINLARFAPGGPSMHLDMSFLGIILVTPWCVYGARALWSRMRQVSAGSTAEILADAERLAESQSGEGPR